MAPGFEVEVASIDGSANLLVEIAALLYQGRLDRDLGTKCRWSAAPEDVAREVERFARFADDQHGDLVLLLVALSTKLGDTASVYRRADENTQAALDKVLAEGRYVAPPGG